MRLSESLFVYNIPYVMSQPLMLSCVSHCCVGTDNSLSVQELVHYEVV